MEKRDALWAISIPFRMYNMKEMDLNTFIFTLSFDAALPNCDVSTARKLVTFALEKGWIERSEKTNLIMAKFELWQPKFFPPMWRPNFSNLQKTPMVELIPLDASIKYEPKIVEKIKLPKPAARTPFSSSKPKKPVESKISAEKKKKPKAAKKDKKEEQVTEEKLPPKKKPKGKKKAKKKGQKSIQDFFR